MKKLILIDGNAILHRAYHSLPPFKTAKGEVTNAIFGFIRMLFDVLIKEKPDYIGIAWDRKAKTYRHEEFKEYKAQRAAPPDDLYPQLPRLKEVLSAMDIPMMEQDGYEADDILATITSKAEKEDNLKIYILTGDKDALQLVTEKTGVLSPVKGISQMIVYDAAKVEEKMGVTPKQVVDFKALSGDSSDNIPGVPGIGPKQAVALLKKYGDIDNIYAHLEELSPGQKSKLEKGKDSAYLSRKLCRLMMDAPFDLDLKKFETHSIDYPKVEKLFEELEFRSLTTKLREIKTKITPVQESQQSLF